MIGSPLAREATVATRTIPLRTVAPPVLIEVPTLPGTGPHRRRVKPRRRVQAVRPRRRLRREIRLAGIALMIVGLLVSSMAVLYPFGPASTEIGDEAVSGPDPFAIELEVPIPEPSDPNDPEGRIELLPVAFPGYLLPGESEIDGEEEYGHARP